MRGFREEALKLVTDNDYKILVEVGVWRGQLSKMLYQVANQLYLVDPWSLQWNKFERPDGVPYECNMGEPFKTQEDLNKMYRDVSSAMPNAIVVRESSITAAMGFDDASVDFVYLDSIHTYEYCLSEIKSWLPKIKPGGMIAGDDYMTKQPEVSKAVDEIFGPQDTKRTWGVKV